MGSIYQVRNKTNGKCYIGQTQDTKVKNGKPYNYGIAGRWCDHVSSAFRGAKTPLAAAILSDGADNFDVICLESNVAEERLDEREAHWISVRNTMVPNGYNVMRHARCKHREQTTLAEHYIPTTTNVRICSVKRNGVSRIVHVYLDRADDSVRLVFGQSNKATYEQAIDEAREFATIFAMHGIEVFEEEANDPLRKYSSKIEQFRGKSVERIRIARFNHLVALHVKTSDETVRICFGGKTVAFENAYKTAIDVKNKLMEMHANVMLDDEISKSATGGCL
jgi:group I intron endonuclease